MKFGAVPLAKAMNAILAHGVKHANGVFKKGRVLSSEDIAALAAAGVANVIVAQLENDDVGEDDAARQLAVAVAGQGIVAQQAFTGRANIYSTLHGVVVIDCARVNAMNHVDEGLTLATLPPYTVVAPKQMVATVKVIPFSITQEVLGRALRSVDGEPFFNVRAFKRQHISLIITTVPQTKASLVAKSEAAMRERMRAFGLDLQTVITVPHVEDDVCSALQMLKQAGSDCILLFGASAIVDRNDVIPAALVRAGGDVVHLGMPVDPGNLLLLGRLSECPVIGVPSCARSPKRNGFDWVLERVLADVAVTGHDIMDMGVGGLLSEIPSRPSPRELQLPRAARVVAVVLAAGLGRRMQGPKMLADFHGRSVIAETISNIAASSVDEIVVVTGHDQERVSAAVQAPKVRIVHNPNYESGMASSLRAGVMAAQGADAVLICLGDMPKVSATVIDRMLAAFNPTEHRSIVVPKFKGEFGNPVLWGAEHFVHLMALEGDKGARHLIADLKSEATEIEGDEGVLLDADTPVELARLRAI